MQVLELSVDAAYSCLRRHEVLPGPGDSGASLRDLQLHGDCSVSLWVLDDRETCVQVHAIGSPHQTSRILMTRTSAHSSALALEDRCLCTQLAISADIREIKVPRPIRRLLVLLSHL
jgi:hypothetical protein